MFQTCSSDRLRPEFRENIAHLKRLNPGWEHRLYTDADLDALFEAELAEHQRALLDRVDRRYRIVHADVFRYLVMHRTGGVYLDLKSTARRPFDEIVRPDDRFLLSQWKAEPGHWFSGFGRHAELSHVPGGEFQQWCLVSAPGHAFPAATLARTFDNIARYDRWRDARGRLGVLRLSGPICFTQAIAPLLDDCPHRRVDYRSEGIDYSLFGETHESNAPHRDASHYSRQTAPVVRHGLQLRQLGSRLAGRLRGRLQIEGRHAALEHER